MELYAGIDLHSRNTFVFLLGCDPDSRKNFDKAVALSPDNGFNFYNRGSAYLSMEKYTDALKDLTEAIRLIHLMLRFVTQGPGHTRL